MREIKFEYGFESVNGIVKKTYSLSEIPFINEKCDFWQVLPVKYVRQYTGLKDKNGVEIYEGDIIRSETYRVKISDNTRVIGSEHTNDYIIEWSTKPFIDGWQLRQIDTSLKSKIGIGNISNTSLHVYIKSCEVIGNIHEDEQE